MAVAYEQHRVVGEQVDQEATGPAIGFGQVGAPEILRGEYQLSRVVHRTVNVDDTFEPPAQGQCWSLKNVRLRVKQIGGGLLEKPVKVGGYDPSFFRTGVETQQVAVEFRGFRVVRLEDLHRTPVDIRASVLESPQETVVRFEWLYDQAGPLGYLSCQSGEIRQ